MKMMSGAAMVVEALKDVGVTHVFGYPGGAVLDIYDALFAQDDVKHVLVRHEQAAAHYRDCFFLLRYIHQGAIDLEHLRLSLAASISQRLRARGMRFAIRKSP